MGRKEGGRREGGMEGGKEEKREGGREGRREGRDKKGRIELGRGREKRWKRKIEGGGGIRKGNVSKGSQMVHCKIYSIGIDGRVHVHPT